MAWFEAKEEAEAGTIVQRVDRTSAGLSLQLSTVAEILNAAAPLASGLQPRFRRLW